MEPERQIEKLLRAFARKRRDEVRDSSGLELHPATRRLLQAEVARRTPTSGRAGGFFRGLLKALRPQLAFGLCTAAVLLVGAVFVLPLFTSDKNKPQLAKASPAATETPAQSRHAENAPAAAPATPPPLAIADVELKLADARADKDRGFQAANSALYGERENERRTSESAPPASARTATAAAGQLSADTGSAGRKLTRDVKENLDLAEVDKQKRSAEQFSRSKADSTSLKNGVQPTPQVRQRAPAEGKDTNPQPLFADSLRKENPSDVFQPARTEPAAAAVLAQKTPAIPNPTLGLALNDETRANWRGTSGNFATQKFSQLASGPAAEKSQVAAAKAVLNSFQFEQAGDQIRIVDSDGSTYAGYVQTADGPARSPAMEAETVAPVRAYRDVKEDNKKVVAPEKATPEPAAPNYFFRVTGTNRSLNQQVVFSGNLLAITNGLPVSTDAPLALGGKLQIAAPNQSQLPLLNSRISGKARVGESNEIQINAVPVAR